jgi:hypothetical protein
MAAELEKERAAKKAISEEKAALEAELESLSQALFEEVSVFPRLTYRKTRLNLYLLLRQTRWLLRNE